MCISGVILVVFGVRCVPGYILWCICRINMFLCFWFNVCCTRRAATSNDSAFTLFGSRFFNHFFLPILCYSHLIVILVDVFFSLTVADCQSVYVFLASGMGIWRCCNSLHEQVYLLEILRIFSWFCIRASARAQHTRTQAADDFHIHHLFLPSYTKPTHTQAYCFFFVVPSLPNLMRANTL